MVAKDSRFRCSIEADITWGRLLSLYTLKRIKGDCQREGMDWANVRSSLSMDLGTNARLLYCASERSLELLAVMGQEQEKGAALAKRRLAGHGTNQEERRYNLDRETRDKLLEGAKEFLSWSLRDDAELEMPDLPF